MRNLTIFQNTNVLPAVLKISLGVLALFASANITLPVKPVAVTLHTLVVMIIGLTYSRKEAITTITSYITFGILGMPMFGNLNGGLLYLMGPVGGYYLGMVLACYAMPYLKEKFNIANLFNCIIGQVLIYTPGVLWLSTFIGLEASIYKGFLVYIPSGIVKIILLLSILKVIKKS